MKHQNILEKICCNTKETLYEYLDWPFWSISFMERCTISLLMLVQYDSVEDVQGLKLQGILSELKKRGWYNNGSNIEFAVPTYS